MRCHRRRGGGSCRSFRYQQGPILVDILVTTGALINGSLYVPESPQQTHEADEVINLLNDERSFVPLAVTGKRGGPFVLQHGPHRPGAAPASRR